MGTAFGERHNVMDFLRRGVPAGLQAFLTQRMRSNMPCAGALPIPTVPLAGGRVTLELFVLLGGQLRMH